MLNRLEITQYRPLNKEFYILGVSNRIRSYDHTNNPCAAYLQRQHWLRGILSGTVVEAKGTKQRLENQCLLSILIQARRRTVTQALQVLVLYINHKMTVLHTLQSHCKHSCARTLDILSQSSQYQLQYHEQHLLSAFYMRKVLICLFVF